MSDVLDPVHHRACADERRAVGDELAAMAHLIAAQTLAAPRRSLADLTTVATGYFTQGDHAAARYWYELLLALDPRIASAHQNLAAIHADAGRHAEADASRTRAYAIQRVFVDATPEPTRRLLVLGVGRSSGNIPVETLLSAGRSQRITYVVDYASEAEDADLPPFDVVFNAIGEPDAAVPLTARLQRFAESCGRPMLNSPAQVERTQRHRLPESMAGLRNVVTARCVRHDDTPASRTDLQARLAAGGIALPVLVRPTESHGGIGLVRCETIEEVEAAVRAIDGPHYITSFVDTGDAAGHHRKARIVFIDREPFAYHLAISPHWMVHYHSADMQAHAWKLDEERAFIDDPLAALGERAMAAIRAIGRQLDLDYAGIDFTLLPDGRVFVFEANATMLVHRERQSGPLAHKNAAVQRIADAFERLLARRTAAARFSARACS